MFAIERGKNFKLLSEALQRVISLVSFEFNCQRDVFEGVTISWLNNNRHIGLAVAICGTQID